VEKRFSSSIRYCSLLRTIVMLVTEYVLMQGVFYSHTTQLFSLALFVNAVSITAALSCRSMLVAGVLPV